MKLNVLLLINLFLLISCTSPKSTEEAIDFNKDRDFRIINVFNQQKYSNLEERLPELIVPNAEIQEPYAKYSYLSLKPNKEYTFLLGNQFMYGTYSVSNKNEIVLRSDEFGELPLKILKNDGLAIQIQGDFKKFKSDFMVEIGGNTRYYLNLKNDFKALNKENDIRSVAFNEWRFRPSQKENDEQIKKRLILNLKYIAAYMRVHLYGDFERIQTEGIHSPFLHAKNGLVLLEWMYVSYFWKNMFYDEKDAKKAFKLLNQAFNRAESPEFINNWLEYNEVCMQKIIDTIETME